MCVCWSVSVEEHGKNVSKIASKTIKLADSRDELNQCTCLLHVMGSAIYRTHFSIDNEALQIEIEIYCTYKMSLVFWPCNENLLKTDITYLKRAPMLR